MHMGIKILIFTLMKSDGKSRNKLIKKLFFLGWGLHRIFSEKRVLRITFPWWIFFLSMVYSEIGRFPGNNTWKLVNRRVSLPGKRHDKKPYFVIISAKTKIFSIIFWGVTLGHSYSKISCYCPFKLCVDCKSQKSQYRKLACTDCA